MATAGRVDDDAGAWGLCARRVVQAGRVDTLSIQSVWRAWCEAGHDGNGHHQDVAGGIKRSEFPRRLRELIPLSVAKTDDGGRSQRPRLVRLEAVGRRAGRGVRARRARREGGFVSGPSSA